MDLPEYVSHLLARSPLVLVSAQVNYEEVGSEVIHPQARDVQRRLGKEWAQLQTAPRVTANLTSFGITSEPPRQAYRLLTEDSNWAILLNPDSVSIETRVYPGWAQFREKVSNLVRAVSEVFDPAREHRLGLRYVDQVALPAGYGDWEGLIPDGMLGMVLDERLRDGVLASDQRVLLQMEAGVRCVFRHGLFADESGRPGEAYLLDYDLFRDDQRDFDSDQIAESYDQLHQHAGTLFRASLSDKLYDWLKG